MKLRKVMVLVMGCGVMASLLACPKGFSQSVQDVRSQISQTRSDISSLKQQIDQLNSDNANLQSQISQLQSRLQSLQDQQTALNKKNARLRTHIAHLRGAQAAEAPNAAAGLGLKDLTDDSSGATAAKSNPAPKKKRAVSARHAAKQKHH